MRANSYPMMITMIIVIIIIIIMITMIIIIMMIITMIIAILIIMILIMISIITVTVIPTRYERGADIFVFKIPVSQFREKKAQRRVQETSSDHLLV